MACPCRDTTQEMEGGSADKEDTGTRKRVKVGRTLDGMKGCIVRVKATRTMGIASNLSLLMKHTVLLILRFVYK
jgi:hypothetical protein